MCLKERETGRENEREREGDKNECESERERQKRVRRTHARETNSETLCAYICISVYRFFFKRVVPLFPAILLLLLLCNVFFMIITINYYCNRDVFSVGFRFCSFIFVREPFYLRTCAYTLRTFFFSYRRSRIHAWIQGEH